MRVSVSSKVDADNQGSLLFTVVEQGFTTSPYQACMCSESFFQVREAILPNVHLAQDSCLYILYICRDTEQVLFCQTVSLKRNAGFGESMCYMQCPVPDS